jgi:hypothetical protein
MKAGPARFDRYALVGDIALSVRRLLRRTLLPFAAVLAAISLYLVVADRPGAVCFAMIAGGACAALFGWRELGIGIPLLPAFVLQQFVAYALPVLTGNEVVLGYAPRDLAKAGEEVLIFLLALIASWQVGMRTFRPSLPISYILSDFHRGGGRKVKAAGFGLAAAATGYLVLQAAGAVDPILALLPTGSGSAANALVGAAGTCGFFLVAMLAGGRELKPGERLLFWLLLFLNCFINAASFLLSTVIYIVFAAIAGLFWSSGRVPWRFLVVFLSILGFLNLGKYAMRDRYWHINVEGRDPITSFSLAQMPSTYAEWMGASVDAITGGPDRAQTWQSADAKKADSHSLFDRINNLQNLLFVVDAMDRRHLAPLGGETYLLIPPMLLPTLLWPNKPHPHAGQIRLNVYFGRQDLLSTYSTYVAWGLLPEAYGNFGPIWGAIIIGGCLGLFFAWLENATARKMVLSLEGFLGFAIFLGFANSVEMVASVLVTSVAQAIEPLVIAALPFVRRTHNRHAGDDTANPEDPA